MKIYVLFIFMALIAFMVYIGYSILKANGYGNKRR